MAEGRCILFEDPRDDVERRVAAIWSAQMDVRSVGVNDDFLELGGDSLSALGIIAAIETEFGRSLDVYEFMSAASVRRAGRDPAVTMALSVRRRIADIARAEPDRTALVGFDTDLAEQVVSWREFADRVADAADALRAALDRRTRSCAVVLAGNTLPAAIGIAAALAAEVPVFPLNPATPPAERDALLRLLGRRFGHGYLMDAQLRPQRMDLPAGPSRRPATAPLRTCWQPARARAFRRSPPDRDHCATTRPGRRPW